jgi:hypothetical protein
MRALAIAALTVVGGVMLALFIYLMLDSSRIDDENGEEELNEH